MIDANWIRKQLDIALLRLVSEHDLLFDKDANERSLTHWLACLLTPLFPEWHVDCEYNRDGYEPKRLFLACREVATTDTDAQSVYPDIIIHQRGTPNNLLVIEAKKTSSTRPRDEDLVKLHAFTRSRDQGGLGYRYGALILLDVLADPPAASVTRWVCGTAA